MSMRTLLRYRAHATMETLGLTGVNKVPKIGTHKGKSFFAEHWRKYIRLEDVKRGKRRGKKEKA